MKKLIITGLIACTALTFAGCSGNTPKDSTAKADSANATKDSSNKKDPATWGQEVSGPDAKFAVDAANGGMAEVALGNLAKRKAVSADVKDFGAMMVEDHSKANEDLKKLAAPRHIVLPQLINREEKDIMTELEKKDGADFDNAYIDVMVKDHKKDIEEFEEAGKVVKYPEMTAFINNTLPVLKKHLAAIEKIQQAHK